MGEAGEKPPDVTKRDASRVRSLLPEAEEQPAPSGESDSGEFGLGARERKLYERERRLLTLTESLPHLLWACSAEGLCEYLSPQWVAYTGIEEELQLGTAWLDVVHPDDRLATANAWSSATAASNLYDQEFRLRRHDGEYRWFKSRATRHRDAQGNSVWYGTCTDIQDFRDARADIERLNHELEDRVRARTLDLERANRMLQTTASRLARAQRITHVGSWSFDVETNRTEWSEELFRIFGLEPRAEAPSWASQKVLFSETSWSTLTAARNRNLQTGENYELELDVIRPTGEARTVIARSDARHGESGRVTRLEGTFQDVTELTHARRERDVSLERARLATLAAKLGVWDWDIERDELVWDQRMSEIYGVPHDRTRRRYVDWRAFVHPDDLEGFDRALSEVRDADNELDTSFRILGPDGSLVHVRSAAQIFRDRNDEPMRMLGVNWDVTQEREVESALRQSESLLRDFVRYAPAAIAMLDAELRYIQVSERWVSDYGLEDRDILGRAEDEIFPNLPESWKTSHQRVLRGSIERCEEDPFPRADGGIDWLQWEARPWYTARGEVGGIVFFTQHVTARKEMELLLRRQKDELERSNRDLEHFAYAASHDLQEPLRAVSGCARLLSDRYHGKLDASADELVDHIVAGADRMRALILDLLSYSRVGTRGASFQKVESAEIVREALENLRAGIVETGATFRFGPLPRVRADASQLTLLFQNLIGNAIKYKSARPPEITIAAERGDTHWIFTVEDNGIGIDSEYFERIFVLFQRLHTRHEYEGTGIGLALCKKIVERHGGEIGVRSTLGVGSTFFFTLPFD